MNEMVRYLSSAARTLGWHYESVREGWIHKLSKPSVSRYVYGYTFPHNDSVAAKLARDKAAVYELLNRASLPAVRHVLVRSGEQLDEKSDVAFRMACSSIASTGSAIVVKPLFGSGGRHVSVHDSVDSGVAQLRRITPLCEGAAAVSPYVEISCETRVVILDGAPLLAFTKQRTTDWRHNLAFGARPILKSIPECQRATNLAVDTCEVLGLRLAAVDVVELPSGDIFVLEVNDSIKLDAAFSSCSGQCEDLAAFTYEEIVRSMER